MNTLVLLGTLFVSIAVIITIFGEIIDIATYFGIKQPEFRYPGLAFLGLISIIFLLAAIVAKVIVPGADTSVIANQMAGGAITFSFLPWLIAVIIAFKVKVWSIVGSLLIIGGTFAYAIYFVPEYLSSLFVLLPLLAALVFACMPILFSYCMQLITKK